MMTRMLMMITACFGAFVSTSALAWALTFLHKAGGGGAKVIEMVARAPFLDVVVALLTWIPWVVWGFPFGWRGVFGCVLGQVAGLLVWCWGHEQMHKEALAGPRIVKFVNRTVGRWQNHVALWVTAISLPLFWMIRLVEVASYWPLVVLLKFPAYKHGDWINVSRQKFDGLIGHDLIWCLYCDWMTGVYSLGAEMLRNVESFWCPIRFYDGKKCDNCKLDFPDVDGGWVGTDKAMKDVVAKMEEQYAGGNHSWFGHPTRLTVKGKPIHSSEPHAASLAPDGLTTDLIPLDKSPFE